MADDSASSVISDSGNALAMSTNLCCPSAQALKEMVNPSLSRWVTVEFSTVPPVADAIRLHTNSRSTSVNDPPYGQTVIHRMPTPRAEFESSDAIRPHSCVVVSSHCTAEPPQTKT